MRIQYRDRRQGRDDEVGVSTLGTGRVQRHGRSYKSFQCLPISFLAFVDIDGTPGVATETGIEEA